MEKQTQPLQAKTTTQTTGDEPNLNKAFLAIGGFILFAAVIVALVLYGHL